MAELTNNSGRGSGRAARVKQVPRVDLTAMVDLAFLLITFFMLTTSLTKTHAMDVALPVDVPDPIGISEERSLTLCLGKDNEIYWYRGDVHQPLEPAQVSTYAGIHQILVREAKEVAQLSNDPRKQIVVLIKPSNKSTYKNLVDILDEMKRTDMSTYAIVDITPEDLKQMQLHQVF